MGVSNLIFAVILAVALGFFARSAKRLNRWLHIGHDEVRTDHPDQRTKNFLLIGLGQSKILRDPVGGMMHALVFWGFCVLGLGTLEIMIQGLYTPFTWDVILPRFLYLPYVVSQEIFAVFVLIPVVYLLYRRLVIKPKRFAEVSGADAVFILSMIATLMLTLLLLFVMELRTGAPTDGRIISGLLLPLFSGVSPVSAYNLDFFAHALPFMFFNELATMAATAKAGGPDQLARIAELVEQIQKQFDIASESLRKPATEPELVGTDQAERFIEQQMAQTAARRQAIVKKVRRIIAEELQLRTCGTAIADDVRPLLNSLWAPMMAMHLLHHGPDSAEWKRGIAVLERIVAGLDPARPDQRSATLVQALREELESDFKTVGLAETRIVEGLDGFETALLRIGAAAQGLDPALDTILDTPPSEAELPAVSTPETRENLAELLEQLVQPGAWFLIHDHDRNESRWMKAVAYYAGLDCAAFAEFNGTNTLLLKSKMLLDDLLDVGLIGPILSQVRAEWPALDNRLVRLEAVRRMIGAMVGDVIDETRRNVERHNIRTPDDVRNMDRALVAFSPQMAADLGNLRLFLTERMYRHWRVNRTRSQARRILADMFQLFMAQPDVLPPEWFARVTEGAEHARARGVCDYIAGMTDRFAIEEHRRLFQLSPWG